MELGIIKSHLLLFDFSEAFDTVCHVRLLQKLRNLGFSLHTLRWFEAYLSARSQSVLNQNSTRSSFSSTNRGVPQGSVLGPLLFALFINNICLLFGPNFCHILYADDLQIYIQCSPYDLGDTAIRLSTVADAILEWTVNNNLKINLSKTKAIVFESVPYINKLESIARTHIMIGGVAVHFESSVRNLGINLGF